MITVVGLGNKDGDITLKGMCAIDDADTVIVKTALTDTYKYFEDIENITCDRIYQEAEDFDSLDKLLAEEVLKYDKGNTVYCVNGNGYDDRSVKLLKELRADIKIIAGLSRESDSLAEYPATSYLAVSAYDLAEDASFDYDSTQLALIVKDIDCAYIAAEVKSALSRMLGDETDIELFGAAGKETVKVYELDRLENYDYSCSVYAPKQKFEDKNVYNFMDLMRLMRILRSDNGCEWDKAQTHSSIRHNAIEEAYELADAINNEDIDNIIEEAGDIILQGVFHTVIGEDEGEFEAQEVLSGLCKKLIGRHTHIFGDVVATNAQEALKAWEAAKAVEKKYKSLDDKIAKIAKGLPSLLRAQKVQKATKKAGYEFTSIEQVESKFNEEYLELKSARSAEEREKEGGDLLFAAVNLLRWLEVDAETALARSIEKYVGRVAAVEKLTARDGVSADKLSAEQLDAYWREAKENENR